MKKKIMTIIGGFLGLITLSSCSVPEGFGGVSESNSSVTESAPAEESVTLSVTVPRGEVYPYILPAQQYLEAGAGANVRDYLLKVDNPYKGIKIKWECNANVASYKVEYATKADYSDAIVEECSGDKDEIELYNLYKETKYYVRVTAQNEGGMSLTSAEGIFKTTALGPRVMKIDDIHNVRDMGGYETLDGKTTVQGILYRGGTLMPADVYDSRLTKDGKKYMSEIMGIKTEIDFRGKAEAGNLTESVIPNATLEYATLSGYSDAYKYTAGYKKVFTLLADKNNYPIYYHCTGGADRTGTVSFLLNALLGVDETTCIQDYEFTSYSLYGERNTQSGAYGTTYFQPFLATLKTYEGDTLQEKVESYLLSIGITKEQIANIKAIMYGEEMPSYVSAQAKYIEGIDDKFTVSVVSDNAVKALYIADQQVSYTEKEKVLTINEADMPKLSSGAVNGKVVLENGKELPFSFAYEADESIELDEYMEFDENGMITLNATNALVTGTKSVGYGQKVCVRMQSTLADINGGITVMIGSYGFQLRGGEFRAMQLADGGTITETARYTGLGADVAMFNDGEALLFLTIDFVDGKPVMTIQVLSNGSVLERTYTYAASIAGEIASEQAKVTFSIHTTSCKELKVYTSTAWENR